MNRLQSDEHRQILIGDKNYIGASFEEAVDQAGIVLLRPVRKGENPRPGARFFKPLLQIIESINDTPKANSIHNTTADAPPQASPPASSNASWP